MERKTFIKIMAISLVTPAVMMKNYTQPLHMN